MFPICSLVHRKTESFRAQIAAADEKIISHRGINPGAPESHV